MEELKPEAKPQESANCRTCSDHDEDCEDLPDKVGCWLYAPEKGMCPYLRSEHTNPEDSPQ